MKLSYLQKKALYKDGYVKLSGVIPKVMVDRARKAIHHSIGKGIPREDVNTFSTLSFSPELQQDEAITDLFNESPVKSLLGSVIDLEETNPITSAQIALRFPIDSDRPRQAKPHLDGMPGKNNGVPEGKILNSTALVSVLLSDLPNENAGNFTVWPGTHHLYEQYFRKHGAESLLDGMPPIDLPDPIQVKGKAGDVFIAHYQLGHGSTPNISSEIRYATFYRIKHKSINEETWQQPMENIWMHWPGMQDVINEHE